MFQEKMRRGCRFNCAGVFFVLLDCSGACVGCFRIFALVDTSRL
jgi:hypothetical protein